MNVGFEGFFMMLFIWLAKILVLAMLFECFEMLLEYFKESLVTRIVREKRNRELEKAILENYKRNDDGS